MLLVQFSNKYNNIIKWHGNCLYYHYIIHISTAKCLTSDIKHDIVRGLCATWFTHYIHMGSREAHVGPTPPPPPPPTPFHVGTSLWSARTSSHIIYHRIKCTCKHLMHNIYSTWLPHLHIVWPDSIILITDGSNPIVRIHQWLMYSYSYHPHTYTYPTLMSCVFCVTT